LSKQLIHETTRTKDTNRHEVWLVLLRVISLRVMRVDDVFSQVSLRPSRAVLSALICG